MRQELAVMQVAALEAYANRRSFWTQITLMILNDIVWVGFWLLFFENVGSIRGWDSDRVLLLFSVATAGLGLSLGPCANARELGRMISDGKLDAVLTIPVRPLGFLLFRRVRVSGCGDFLFGVGLFALAGNATPMRCLLFCAGIVAGAVVFTSFLVLVSSLTFWVGGRGEHVDVAFNATLTFATYPLDMFGGLTKFMLFTAVPVAFITGVPTRLIDDFDLGDAGLLALVAAALATCACLAFAAGLRRYRSGSSWTTA